MYYIALSNSQRLYLIHTGSSQSLRILQCGCWDELFKGDVGLNAIRCRADMFGTNLYDVVLVPVYRPVLSSQPISTAVLVSVYRQGLSSHPTCSCLNFCL